MKKILLIATLGAVVTFTSCESKKSNDETTSNTEALIQEATNSVAEAVTTTPAIPCLGAFEGVIAQADGPGFQTTLELKEDNTFSLKTVADAGAGTAETKEGTFTFEADKNLVTLTSTTSEVLKYEYADDALILLTPEGNRPEMVEMYRLARK